MSKLARRHRKRKFKKNPSSTPKRNPPIASDLVHWVLPGFGGFAATRMLTAAIQKIIAKRAPKYAKHAGALASVSSFLASWFLGHRVKWLAAYHTPVTVGSAIAAGQSLLQIYAPNKLGWIVSDATPRVAIAAPAPQQQALPDHIEEINDDPSWYTYNDAFDGGRYAGSLGKAPPQEGIAPPPPIDPAAIDEPQEGDEELAAGIFSGG